MLVDEPLWGYRLMTKIKEDHDVKVGPPVIYPLLDSLEASGLVEARETYEGKRKRNIYNVTQEGLERVKHYRSILLEFSK
jgi:DNA-binding PadR family transcriptional regulator